MWLIMWLRVKWPSGALKTAPSPGWSNSASPASTAGANIPDFTILGTLHWRSSSWSLSFLHDRIKTGCSNVEWSDKCCAEEINHFLDLLAPLLLIQLRILLAFITARPDCWLMFGQLATKTPGTFPAELFPGLPVPSQCRGIVHAKCRALHLSWLNIIRLLSASLGPSGWHLSPWVYWLVLSAWLYHWTLWGCTISHPLGYQ